MPDTIPVGKYYNFDNKNVDVVYNPAKDEGKGCSCGGVVFVDCTYNEENNVHTATKTAGEIYNLIMDGNTVVFDDLDMLMPCLGVRNRNREAYKFYVCVDQEFHAFNAETDSDYPDLITTK